MRISRGFTHVRGTFDISSLALHFSALFLVYYMVFAAVWRTMRNEAS
jgi:hypothetical protein